MLNRMKSVTLALLLTATVMNTSVSMAQTVVYPVQITEVATGWADATIGVYTDKPVVNPAHCPTPDLYVSEAADPGNRTYYAAALTALANKLTTTLVISNTACSATGRPKLWAVTPSAPR
ncbi:hypothetical protein DyAD56_14130 [Dyella sp. AD56]|nr:hypothetical protein DyAD56_14130 [Dyella sp. AD56]